MTDRPTKHGASPATEVSETGESEKDAGATGPVSVVAENERIASVDTLRGLVILLMVFVNDLGAAAPAWMHHIQPSNADGMTLADVVFPAFLFIVGVSIPLAIERALQRGKTRWSIVGHILTRTSGLLAMGLIGVNFSAEIGMPSNLWGLLAYVAIILAWCIVPSEAGTKRRVLLGLRGLGIVGLIALVCLYRREPVATEVLGAGEVEQWRWLRTQWWGILGLIGWAYLVASLIYLMLRQRREWLMGAMAMLLVLNIAMTGDGLFAHVDSKQWLGPMTPLIDATKSVLAFVGSYVDVAGALGSLASVSVAGTLLGSTLAGPQKLDSHSSRIRWSLVYAAGLFLAGLLCDGFAGINKIAATPTWCLWCSALTCVAWVLVYRLMDVGGITSWSVVARPAGANPLIAYLLHPIILWVVSLAGLSASLFAYKNSPNGWVVIAGSIAMALVVSALTGLIARAGLRVRI